MQQASFWGILEGYINRFNLVICLRWWGIKKRFLIPSSSHRFLTFFLSNYHPLSDTIKWRISNLHMMFLKMNLEALASMSLDKGSIRLLSKVINSNNDITCIGSFLRHGSNEVNLLLGKWPMTWYHSELLGWLPLHVREALALVTFAHN